MNAKRCHRQGIQVSLRGDRLQEMPYESFHHADGQMTHAYSFSEESARPAQLDHILKFEIQKPETIR